MRLFDAPAIKRPRWTGNSLPVLARPLCPRQACREPLMAMRPTVQPALFFHGGYGAAERSTAHVCIRCGWSVTTCLETINPRHLVGDA